MPVLVQIPTYILFALLNAPVAPSNWPQINLLSLSFTLFSVSIGVIFIAITFYIRSMSGFFFFSDQNFLNIILLIIIIIVLLLVIFFHTSCNLDFSEESKRQQVSSGLQDTSQYSSWFLTMLWSEIKDLEVNKHHLLPSMVAITHTIYFLIPIPYELRKFALCNDK